MSVKTGEREVALTVRECKRCGNRYTWPKGSRRPNAECPKCQPNLPGMEAAK